MNEEFLKTPNNILSIWSPPRSGSTWLGQIFNSSPLTLYRHQPLFSYPLKNYLTDNSNNKEIDSFFNKLTNCTDEFVLHGLASPKERELLTFSKQLIPTHLLMKHVRYHHIINNLLDKTNNFRVIGLIRHPCATINSWIKSAREFDRNWNPLEEWRLANKKNLGRFEEFNGYDKWKEIVINFNELKIKYPEKVYLVQYNELINHTIDIVRELFSFANLHFESQTEKFIHDSKNFNIESEYAVFKTRNLDFAWKKELNRIIIEEIFKDLEGTDLAYLIN